MARRHGLCFQLCLFLWTLSTLSSCLRLLAPSFLTSASMISNYRSTPQTRRLGFSRLNHTPLKLSPSSVVKALIPPTPRLVFAGKEHRTGFPDLHHSCSFGSISTAPPPLPQLSTSTEPYSAMAQYLWLQPSPTLLPIRSSIVMIGLVSPVLLVLSVSSPRELDPSSSFLSLLPRSTLGAPNLLHHHFSDAFKLLQHII